MSQYCKRHPVGRGLVPRRNVRSTAGDEPPPYGQSAVDELTERSEVSR